MMKKIFILSVLVLLISPCLTSFGRDGDVRGSYVPRTGDAILDTTLGNINIRTYGKNLEQFISNISMSFNIPRTSIEVMMDKEKMTPADVYMTAEMAKITNRPINAVVDEYKNNKGKGWGVIAKRLGIKPGSKEFKALKKRSNNYLDESRHGSKNKHNEKSKERKNKHKNK